MSCLTKTEENALKVLNIDRNEYISGLKAVHEKAPLSEAGVRGTMAQKKIENQSFRQGYEQHKAERTKNYDEFRKKVIEPAGRNADSNASPAEVEKAKNDLKEFSVKWDEANNTPQEGVRSERTTVEPEPENLIYDEWNDSYRDAERGWGQGWDDGPDDIDNLAVDPFAVEFNSLSPKELKDCMDAMNSIGAHAKSVDNMKEPEPPKTILKMLIDLLMALVKAIAKFFGFPVGSQTQEHQAYGLGNAKNGNVAYLTIDRDVKKGIVQVQLVDPNNILTQEQKAGVIMTAVSASGIQPTLGGTSSAPATTVSVKGDIDMKNVQEAAENVGYNKSQVSVSRTSTPTLTFNQNSTLKKEEEEKEEYVSRPSSPSI